MGITRQGKVAVLTNYREATPANAIGAHSRGAIVNAWLTSSPSPSPSPNPNPDPDHHEHEPHSTREFVNEMVASEIPQHVGGFSLVCGHVNEPLAIVSNRSANPDQITWVATDRGQTIGLSNTAFGDRTWPKIIEGEKLTKAAIDAHVTAGEDEDGLISRLLRVLSTDTLPRLSEGAATETYLNLLKESIFIPVIGARDEPDDEVAAACIEAKVPVESLNENDRLKHHYTRGAYGTQKQTIILVTEQGRVRFFERTLYDNNVNAIPAGKGDRSFEFMI